ncbi:hypothetical protein ABC977_15185 [Thioalkalicoccus limnaeus]|uniref:Uncharacterized protein n=1 Tax=Thioalkalicoccus limnaeus TaxID=120681 RepID=A0ABV4BHI4_9GAMM
MDEYLRAKPMVTPAIAGMATMTMTSTLVVQFGLPPALTALAFAFLFGTLAFGDRSLSRLQRGVLYLINSVTIFSVAVGINETAVGMMKPPEVAAYEQRLAPDDERSPALLRSWF